MVWCVPNMAPAQRVQHRPQQRRRFDVSLSILDATVDAWTEQEGSGGRAQCWPSVVFRLRGMAPT